MDLKDKIEISWEEFKYRHEHFWKSFYKLGFIIIFLVALPHFELKGLAGDMKIWLIASPIGAFVLSIFSRWLLLQEQNRIEVISEKYKIFRDKYFDSSDEEDTSKVGDDSMIGSGHKLEINSKVGAYSINIVFLILAMVSVIDVVIICNN